MEKFTPISSEYDAAVFDLRLEPDGVYRVDGRAIPATYHPAIGVNNCEPIVLVHDGHNSGVRLGRCEWGIDVEK